MLSKLARIVLGFGGICVALLVLAYYVNQPPRDGGTQNNKPIPLAPPSPQSGAITASDPSQAKLDAHSYEGNAVETESMKAIVMRFNAGDLNAALVLARQVLADAKTTEGFKSWVKKQMPTLLTSAGWLQLKSDRCYEAIDLLREADGLEKSPAVSRGLAYCYNKLQNFGVASQYFDDYLHSTPNDADMSRLYADALESDLRFDDAVAVLDKALKLAPTNKDVAESLRAMRAKAAENPKQSFFSTANFRIIFNSEEHVEIVDNIADVLESSLSDFSSRFGFKAPKSPIDVILYSTQSFRNVSTGGPEWASGIFDGRIRIPLKDRQRRLSSDLERTLRHELVHALVAHMSDHRIVATWFSEGLAQILECPDSPCRPDKKLVPLKPGAFLSQDELNAPFIKYDAIKAEKGYRQSLYLLFTALKLADMDPDDTLQKVVSRIDEKASLTSADLIRPAGITFLRLYETAKADWGKSAVPTF